MATQHQDDNGPSIVVDFFKAAVAGAQKKYKTQIDVRTAREILFAFLRSWDGTHETFHNTKSAAIDECLSPGENRSPYTSFVIRYCKLFPKKKKVSAPQEILQISQSDWEEIEKSDEWSVWVCERTREIHLFHNPTMSRSESIYHSRGFELGSVVVEGLPCRNKWLPKRHKDKCFEVTYRILSGK